MASGPTTTESATRAAIAGSHRVVVKIGSSSLTAPDGGLDEVRIRALAATVVDRIGRGGDVVLVSSGAIAAGIRPLQLKRRPRDLATQQAAASVGQGALMAAYSAAFASHDVLVGQVLLTIDDVTRRGHYTNARRTLRTLLDLGAVPVINENDTVATQEIRFGDNDRLAALVAHLIDADALILLSDVDSLFTGPPSLPGSERIGFVPDADDLPGVDLGTTGSAVGTGGMMTKVEAARIATSAGIPVLLTSSDNMAGALTAADCGTVFAAQRVRGGARKLWLAHATTPRGGLVLDDGAVAAVTDRHKSLLPAGITRVTGTFHHRDPVDLLDGDGVVIARGLVNFDSSELPAMLGRSTKQLAEDLGEQYEREVVHRDDLVVLRRGKR